MLFRVRVTDPDVDVSSRYACRCYRSGCQDVFLLVYVVSRVGVTDPDVDVSSR